ncbi:MAG: AMP-dependent synthetase [Betaproteobacteria bacterium HGW-Betaproteobacteria-22]|nr:MAG: AMP-dependent synthetase [Betaproteobacteria bacterium HGW-Betaproteobacteria-22]
MKHNKLIAAIAEHAAQQPEKIALSTDHTTIDYATLYLAIRQQAKAWHTSTGKTISLAVENSPAWVILDLAALECDIPLVPLPFFFSSAQWLHAIQDAGAQVLITDHPEIFAPLLAERIMQTAQFTIADKTLTQFDLQQTHQVTLPAGTAKVTYTSGTTGNPKGVCLSADNMLKVASSITQASELNSLDIHLNVLPLATLLENVAGVYAPLLAGARCIVLPSQDIGLSGASGLDVQTLFRILNASNATTAIFTPELLHALVLHLESGADTPTHLRFLAVGGAAVSPQLIKRAKALLIPVYEGYGLSECASVVALNQRQSNRVGSVGKILPHVHVTLSDDNEIIVHNNTYLGYVGQDNPPGDTVPTGDIGYIDEAGYLFISGRKKNIFITSFGRNVSPEWVERELKFSPNIVQAAIFGEARPWNVAIILPRGLSTTAQIDYAIQTINQHLPDYARIKRWIKADAPFSATNQQLTTNGRNRREMIWQYYQDKINALYEEV